MQLKHILEVRKRILQFWNSCLSHHCVCALSMNLCVESNKSKMRRNLSLICYKYVIDNWDISNLMPSTLETHDERQVKSVVIGPT